MKKKKGRRTPVKKSSSKKSGSKRKGHSTPKEPSTIVERRFRRIIKQEIEKAEENAKEEAINIRKYISGFVSYSEM